MKLSASVIVPILIGSIGLLTLSHNPRFEAYRSVDVLQLLGSGACFGIALFSIITIIRGGRARMR